MSAASLPSPLFPDHVIKVGSNDKTSVLAIQKRLNQVGSGPVQVDGVFSAKLWKQSSCSRRSRSILKVIPSWSMARSDR